MLFSSNRLEVMAQITNSRLTANLSTMSRGEGGVSLVYSYFLGGYFVWLFVLVWFGDFLFFLSVSLPCGVFLVCLFCFVFGSGFFFFGLFFVCFLGGGGFFGLVWFCSCWVFVCVHVCFVVGVVVVYSFSLSFYVFVCLCVWEGGVGVGEEGGGGTVLFGLGSKSPQKSHWSGRSAHVLRLFHSFLSLHTRPSVVLLILCLNHMYWINVLPI